MGDGQGSIRTLTNSAEVVTDTLRQAQGGAYDYTAFGEIYSQSGATENKYLYTGQQFDDASGLYSLRARFYSPALGRFLSQDKYPYNFSNPVELNRYGYAANNPVNTSDPSGNQAFIEYAYKGALIGGALGGLTGGVIAGACGGSLGDIVFGFVSGALMGAGIGAAFGAGYAFAPGITLAAGTTWTGIQFAGSAYDFLTDPNLCTGTKAAISPGFFALGLWGSWGYFGKYGWGGLWRFNWATFKPTVPEITKSSPIEETTQGGGNYWLGKGSAPKWGEQLANISDNIYKDMPFYVKRNSTVAVAEKNGQYYVTSYGDNRAAIFLKENASSYGLKYVSNNSADHAEVFCIITLMAM